MESSPSPGVALVAAAADADWVTRLVPGWLAAKRSQNTRTACARDIGITPQPRASRTPSWLTWCQAEGVDPVTGAYRLSLRRKLPSERSLILLIHPSGSYTREESQ